MREVQVVACALLNVSTPQKTQAASSLSPLEDSGSGDAPRSESVGHVAIKQSNEEGFRLRLFLPACQRYTASLCFHPTRPPVVDKLCQEWTIDETTLTQVALAQRDRNREPIAQ